MKHKGLVCALGLVASIGFFSACNKKGAPDPVTLHLSADGKIKALDPIHASDRYSGIESDRAYEGLLQYHYLKRPFQLVPLLAEAMPEVSEDGKTYTFKIKRGVLFQDDACFSETAGKGRELVAQDFVKSFMRLADPRNESTGWWVLDGRIEGLNQWRDRVAKDPQVGYGEEIAGLKALDRFTFQVRLTRRIEQFKYALAMPFLSVVPLECVEHYKEDFAKKAIGTGPFKLESFDGSKRVVWMKNPTYRTELYPSEGESTDRERGLLEDAGKPIPFVDRVIVDVVEEETTRFDSFLANRIDMTTPNRDRFRQVIDENNELVPALKDRGMRLERSPQIDVTHESFNMDDPVVGKNKLLRQALSLSVDPTHWTRGIYNYQAIPAQGPIPPGIPGFDPEYKNPYREFNIAKAKELLAKAGYPGGKGLAPIQYVTLSDSFSRQINEHMTESFAKLGVKVNFVAFSWPDFIARVRARKGQMWGFAWNGDYPDGENFLQLFYSKNASPGPNDANYRNPEFDKMYERSLELVDGPERTALYQRMVKMVVEDCSWIFGVHRVRNSLVQPWIKNFKIHETEHSSSKYLRVEVSKRPKVD